MERKQVREGGTQYQQMYETSDLQSLVQEYGPTDGLNAGSKEFIGTPKWAAAYMQVPLEESVDERILNAPKTDAQLLNIAQKNATRGVRALKIQIAHRIYGIATDNEIDTEHTYVQGIPSALMENATYGGIARASAAAPTWEAADEDNWDVAVALNKYNIDAWIDSCMQYGEDAGDFLVIMGDTLWNRLKGIFEASNVYTPKGDKSKQGFESMEYSGVEIAKDYLLDRMTNTGSTNNQGNITDILHNGSKTINSITGTGAGLQGGASNTYAGSKWVFVLDLKTWHLMYHKDPLLSIGESCIGITDYFEQDKISGGQEKSLARAKFKGNLICSLPNRNLMRANVS
jgi:hypothetical protein